MEINNKIKIMEMNLHGNGGKGKIPYEKVVLIIHKMVNGKYSIA